MKPPWLTRSLRIGLYVSLGVHLVAAIGVKRFWHGPARLPSGETVEVSAMDVSFSTETELDAKPVETVVEPLVKAVEPIAPPAKEKLPDPPQPPAELPVLPEPVATLEPKMPAPVVPAPIPSAEEDARAAAPVNATPPANQFALAAPPARGSTPVATHSEAGERLMTAGAHRFPGIRATPLYRKNPEPPYPASARRRRQQGVVLLAVVVSAQGRASRVDVRKSSGFAALDEAAMRAVQDWEFEPARLGSLSLESEIEVPVRFQLTN